MRSFLKRSNSTFQKVQSQMFAASATSMRFHTHVNTPVESDLGVHHNHKNPRILITGSLGQIGTNLAHRLREEFGKTNVICTDVRLPQSHTTYHDGPFYYCSVLDKGSLSRVIVDNDIDWIVHLGAIMSVLGEQMPGKTLDLNVDGVRNVLDAARDHQLRCFIPSTMAVFGPSAGRDMTKDDCILQPTTIYGITKVFLEHLGAYYHTKWGVDFRSVRYPGIISPETLPGGGTTDYAVHMYHQALKKKQFVCPVLPDEMLPMMYIDDCLDGTVALLKAKRAKLNRCTYNISGFSFNPKMLEESIISAVPTFKGQVKYEKGLAQDIAQSWPNTMDDSNARQDWGWNPKWDLKMMTDEMLKEIPKFHSVE